MAIIKDFVWLFVHLPSWLGDPVPCVPIRQKVDSNRHNGDA